MDFSGLNDEMLVRMVRGCVLGDDPEDCFDALLLELAGRLEEYSCRCAELSAGAKGLDGRIWEMRRAMAEMAKAARACHGCAAFQELRPGVQMYGDPRCGACRESSLWKWEGDLK